MEQPEFWVLVGTQLPALVGGFTALQRGWLYIGSTIDRERLIWIERFKELRQSFERELAGMAASLQREIDGRAEANADRRNLEQRLQLFIETVKGQTDVLERSVALNEKLFERINRDPGTRSRSSDTSGS